MTTQHCETFCSSMHGTAELYGFEDYQTQPDTPSCIDTIYKQLVTLVKESSSPTSIDIKFIESSHTETANACGRRSDKDNLTRSSSNSSDSSVYGSGGGSSSSPSGWKLGPYSPAARPSGSACSSTEPHRQHDRPSSCLLPKSGDHSSPQLYSRQWSLERAAIPRQQQLEQPPQRGLRSFSSSEYHAVAPGNASDDQWDNSRTNVSQPLFPAERCGQTIENSDLLRAIAALASTPIVDPHGPASAPHRPVRQAKRRQTAPESSSSCTPGMAAAGSAPADRSVMATTPSRLTTTTADCSTSGGSCQSRDLSLMAVRSRDPSFSRTADGRAAAAAAAKPCIGGTDASDIMATALQQWPLLPPQPVLLPPPPEAFSDSSSSPPERPVLLRPKKSPTVPDRFFTLMRKSSGAPASQSSQQLCYPTLEYDDPTADEADDATRKSGELIELVNGKPAATADMFRDRHLKAQSYENLLTDNTSMLLDVAFRLFGSGEDDSTASGCGGSSSASHGSCYDGLHSSSSSLLLAWDEDKMADRNSNYRLSSHSSQLSRSPQSRSPKLPCAPRNVRLTVASETSLCVRFDCSNVVCSASALHYRVEWCTDPSFQALHGSMVLSHRNHTTEVEIHDLKQGAAYYIRVISVGENGSSRPVPTEPPFARPSSWREVQNVKSRTKGQLERLHKLQESYREARPQLMDALTSPNDSPTHARKAALAKRGIKSLFSSSVKFQKNLKRGIYLASLFYNEDRVLVTSDEVLPIVEVDDGYPFNVGGALADFLWLVKVSCSWDVVHDLRRSVSKLAAASGALDLRLKMLQAAGKLQSALGVHDLGQLFYKPLRCGTDIAVIVTISHVRDTKSVSGSSVKWLPLTKLHRHSLLSSSDGGGTDEGAGGSSGAELKSIHADAVMQHLQDIIYYHRLSSFPLSKGLYLGFLKAISSVDDVKLLVGEQTPNVLPHVKLRGQPHVSKAEWQWLHNAAAAPFGSRADLAEEARRFKKLVTKGTSRLLENLGISKEEAATYRLHTAEVLEFSPDVSFIIMMPPREQLCSVQIHEPQTSTTASSTTTCKSNLFYIPMKVFETIHLSTYMASYLHAYSQMACRVDMDALLSQQSMRQAFSSEELKAACWRVGELAIYQQQLESIWQSVRWTTDMLSRGRERKSQCGGGSGGAELTVGSLLSVQDNDDGGGGSSSSGSPTRRSTLGVPELRGSGRSLPSRRSSLTHRGGSDCDTDTGYHSDHSELNALSTTSSNDAAQRQRCHSDATAVAAAQQCKDGLRDGLLSPTIALTPVLDGDSCNSGVAASRELRVHAAYGYGGVGRGTSTVVWASGRTTARELTALVLEQFARQVVAAAADDSASAATATAADCELTSVQSVQSSAAGGSAIDSGDYCLAAVIGCREHVLRDDSLPLQLREPWSRGRLYVRRKDDLLAAVEQESAALLPLHC